MRTLLVSALVASASAASAASAAEAFIYEASEPASLVAPGPICSANAQAFLAVSGPGKECDLDKVDWCSDNTCKTSTSSFYEACKADPTYGPAATSVKSAMELMGYDPTATEGA